METPPTKENTPGTSPIMSLIKVGIALWTVYKILGLIGCSPGGDHKTRIRECVDTYIGNHPDLLSSYSSEERERLSREIKAYVVATARHETGMFWDMTEDADGTNYDLTVNPALAERLGNKYPGDGPLFRGRGYVQITGRRNYADWWKKLFGVDMPVNVTEEKLNKIFCDPQYAKIILTQGMIQGSFTGKGLMKCIKPRNGRLDFLDARTTVNGTDKAEIIAKLAEEELNELSPPSTESPSQ